MADPPPLRQCKYCEYVATKKCYASECNAVVCLKHMETKRLCCKCGPEGQRRKREAEAQRERLIIEQNRDQLIQDLERDLTLAQRVEVWIRLLWCRAQLDEQSLEHGLFLMIWIGVFICLLFLTGLAFLYDETVELLVGIYGCVTG